MNSANVDINGVQTVAIINIQRRWLSCGLQQTQLQSQKVIQTLNGYKIATKSDVDSSVVTAATLNAAIKDTLNAWTVSTAVADTKAVEAKIFDGYNPDQNT